MQYLKQLTMLTFLFFIGGHVHCQTKIERLERNQLPVNISIPENVISIQKWTDKNGVNYFLLAQTDEFISPKGLSEDYRDKEIYAKHFVISGHTTKKLFEMTDAIRECPVDIELEFLTVNPIITDLDKDGISEVWIIYHSICHGDISPPEIKIVMTENQKSSVLLGKRVADIGLNRKVGGEIYSNDFSLLTIPIKHFADSLWTKFKPWNF